MNHNSQNDLYKKELATISKNAGIGGSGMLLGYFFTYLITIIATRVVGAESFGVFYLAQTILSILIMIATLGLNQGVLRYVSYWAGKQDSARIKGTIFFAFKLTLMCSILIAGLLYAGSPFLSAKLGNDELTIAVRIIIISLPFAVGLEIFTSVLQGLRYIAQFSLIKNIIFNAARLVFMILLFLLGLRLCGLLWAMVLSYGVSFLISVLYVYRLFIHKHNNIEAIFERRKIVKFSNPLFWDSLFNQVITALPIFILEYFYGSQDVGVLGVCIRLGMIVSFPLMAVNIVFAPTISNLYARGEVQSLERLFKTVTKWIFTISLATALIFVLFAEPILNIFGSQFVYGTAALFWVVIGQFVNASVGSVGYILSMTGRPRINLMNSILLTILTIVLGYILIRQSGLLGAALTVAISNSFINVLRLLEVYYFEKFHPYNKNYIKPLIAGFTASCLLLVVRKYFFFDGAIYSAFYLVAFAVVFVVVLKAVGFDEDDLGIIKLAANKMKVSFIK